MPFTDSDWMKQALRLGARGEGRTRPNPPVGAVVVRGGRLVGQGWHRSAGTAHAEVLALDAAGRAARGATLYVTLEPCCTHGRTPPCTDRILASGVERVVVGVRDPNPRHAGRGLALLRRHGLTVECGVQAARAAELIAPFARWVVDARPFVTLKLAMTLDGRIADGSGASKWITGTASRAVVRRMRNRSDVVLVGRRTVESDDPGLLCEGHPGLYRAVVDSRGRISPDARIFRDGHADRTLVLTTSACPVRRRAAYEAAGARVLVVSGAGSRVSLAGALSALGGLGFLRVLCEGGGELAGGLMEAGLVDELALFIAPCLVGGARAPCAFVLANGRSLAEAWRFDVQSLRKTGGDVLAILRPRGG